MSGPADVSHGRGGAGNITPDDTPYTDGEVVRAGPVGSQGHGPYSTGRGGAANIGDAGTKVAARKDGDIVPDSAIRASTQNIDYHTGRGGAGNEKHVATGGNEHAKGTDGPAPPISVADKLKAKVFGFFKK